MLPQTSVLTKRQAQHVSRGKITKAAIYVKQGAYILSLSSTTKPTSDTNNSCYNTTEWPARSVTVGVLV